MIYGKCKQCTISHAPRKQIILKILDSVGLKIWLHTETNQTELQLTHMHTYTQIHGQIWRGRLDACLHHAGICPCGSTICNQIFTTTCHSGLGLATLKVNAYFLSFLPIHGNNRWRGGVCWRWPDSCAALRSKNELRMAIFEMAGPGCFFFFSVTLNDSPGDDISGADLAFWCDFLTFRSSLKVTGGEWFAPTPALSAPDKPMLLSLCFLWWLIRRSRVMLVVRVFTNSGPPGLSGKPMVWVPAPRINGGLTMNEGSITVAVLTSSVLIFFESWLLL